MIQIRLCVKLLNWFWEIEKSHELMACFDSILLNQKVTRIRIR